MFSIKVKYLGYVSIEFGFFFHLINQTPVVIIYRIRGPLLKYPLQGEMHL